MCGRSYSIRQRCAPGTFFNEVAGSCDFPENVQSCFDQLYGDVRAENSHNLEGIVEYKVITVSGEALPPTPGTPKQNGPATIETTTETTNIKPSETRTDANAFQIKDRIVMGSSNANSQVTYSGGGQLEDRDSFLSVPAPADFSDVGFLNERNIASKSVSTVIQVKSDPASRSVSGLDLNKSIHVKTNKQRESVRFAQRNAASDHLDTQAEKGNADNVGDVFVSKPSRQSEPIHLDKHQRDSQDPFCVGKTPGTYPDPNHCEYFYQCSASVSRRHHCAPGTVFNPGKKHCDFKQHVLNCMDHQFETKGKAESSTISRSLPARQQVNGVRNDESQLRDARTQEGGVNNGNQKLKQISDTPRQKLEDKTHSPDESVLREYNVGKDDVKKVSKGSAESSQMQHSATKPVDKTPPKKNGHIVIGFKSKPVAIDREVATTRKRKPSLKQNTARRKTQQQEIINTPPPLYSENGNIPDSQRHIRFRDHETNRFYLRPFNHRQSSGRDSHTNSLRSSSRQRQSSLLHVPDTFRKRLQIFHSSRRAPQRGVQTTAPQRGLQTTAPQRGVQTTSPQRGFQTTAPHQGQQTTANRASAVTESDSQLIRSKPRTIEVSERRSKSWPRTRDFLHPDVQPFLVPITGPDGRLKWYYPVPLRNENGRLEWRYLNVPEPSSSAGDSRLPSGHKQREPLTNVP